MAAGWIYNIITGRRRKRRPEDIEPISTHSLDYRVPEVTSRSVPPQHKRPVVKFPKTKAKTGAKVGERR